MNMKALHTALTADVTLRDTPPYASRIPVTESGQRPQAARLIQEAVAAQAAANPGRPAVTFAGAMLTYGQLIERASALSGQLRAAGVRPEVTVASCLPCGLALAPTILGIWMAGGAYVPVDPDGPPRRSDYILRDSQAPVAVVAAGRPMPAPATVATIISVDATGALAGNCHERADVATAVSGPGDLAYVIYTSGTTGHPKGVMVEHGNVTSMARSHEAVLYGGQGNHVRQVALNNITTADSFFSDFVHLAYGRTLHIVDEATRRNPERLAQFITDHGLEVLDGTPTQIRSVLLAGRADALASLTILVVGGEPTTPDLWRQLRELPGVQSYNLYGPTECTVDVSAGSVHEYAEPTIGTPLPGCEIWVVDDALRPVPAGQAGELCITGAHVARGYLNAQAADNARFVWMDLPGRAGPVRGYRTGDRGRRGRAGQIVFIGRSDDQVSIGGHRVELGEVAARLRACAGVLDAAVATQGGTTETTLVAWAVLDSGTAIEDALTELAAALPRHMIPVLHPVDAIPMGPSGKADVTALAQVTAVTQASAAGPAEPNPGGQADAGTAPGAEAVIRATWCEVLAVNAVDAGDDFFALGGDSLKATRAVVAIREALAPGIPIRVIFEHPRFQDFCTAITELAAA